MRKIIIFLALAVITLSACSQAAEPVASEPVASEPVKPEPTLTPASPSEAESIPALPVERGQLFSTSGTCSGCHANMMDEAGQDVTNDKQWRGTMLANAARDPYWLATVRSEITHAPALADEVQQKCATCHMPMAEVTLVAEEQEVTILDQGLHNAGHPLYALAVDGVSCTLCHQVQADNFGQADSFSGGFLVDTQAAEGERSLFGPYETDENLTAIMQSASGFIPVQGLHLAESELCGTCHDLYTPYLDADGQVVGEFAEQLIYSEWANSAYESEQSCQDCHMPLAEGGVQLSITGGPLRSPFNQHNFAGSNVFMVRMLQANAEAVSATAGEEDFARVIAGNEALLAEKTASMAITDASLVDGELRASVVLESQTGHKFPAGYPSRRAWLHIQVLDANGAVVFESGPVSEDGRIAGNDNDLDAASYEPHYTELTSPDQVQIYEAIMINTEGEVTTELLRGKAYLKDNRILPRGFQPDPENPALGRQGGAVKDPDFSAGRDTLALMLDLSQAEGPFTLRVELLYQAIGYRWANNLIQETGAEIEQFAGFYQSVPNLPQQVASAEVVINP